MMYSEKLALAVKSNGKVLREFKDKVFMPFGAEYSLLIKNLNTVRAQVSITIDGVDVADGDTYIVNPNSDFELSRFMKNGNLKQGNRFKFIERTGSVEQHRGVGVEDGLIRVEFQFEKLLPKTKSEQELLQETLDEIKKDLDRKADKGDIYPWRYYSPYWYPYPYPYPYHPPIVWNSTLGGQAQSSDNTFYSATLTSTGPAVTGTAMNVNSVSNQDNAANSFLRSVNAGVAQSNIGGESFKGLVPNTVITTSTANDVGVTVPGSISDQQFVTVSSFPLEDTVHVIVLKMVGETETGKVVQKPVLVSSKPKCVSCGRVNKSGAKFCTDCGTSLEIV